jgi:DNA polymerase V
MTFSSPFKPEAPQYHPGATVPLSWPTADTSRLLKAARVGLRHLFREGYEYKRDGVVMLALAPVGAVTGGLFAAARAASMASMGRTGTGSTGRAATAERRERLLTVLDGINTQWGGTVRILAEGLAQSWQMRRQRMSPRSNTCWAE